MQSNRVRLLALLLSLVCSGLTLSGSSTAAESETERARKILREIDDLWRGESSHGRFTMRVKTEHYTRTLQMEGWTKGTEKTLMRIIMPLKEKGTATLKSDETIYSYLPKTDRTIRLTSGMMMGSWMGSHFTNDDLVKESRMEQDYIPHISFEGEQDGRQVILFELKARPEAAVVWSKLELLVTRKDYLPVYEKYFDEDMRLARTMVFENVRPLAGRPRPTIMRLTPADKPGEFTEFVYESLELNIPLKDSIFSLANLKRN